MIKKNISEKIARGLLVLFIIFISLFALDVFEMPGPWYMILAGLLIHLIPSYLLIGLLILSYRFELLTGLILILLGVIYILLPGDFSTVRYVPIWGSAYLLGGFFIYHGWKNIK
jgi:hypothetical protein